MEVTAELLDWDVCNVGPGYILTGKIRTDKKHRWSDGTRIHTSLIRAVLETENAFIVGTLNSAYSLPKDDPFRGIRTEFPTTSVVLKMLGKGG